MVHIIFSTEGVNKIINHILLSIVGDIVYTKCLYLINEIKPTVYDSIQLHKITKWNQTLFER